ncbi:uncharacterized protein [Leptinotarsa decemlineata]|uniref:uncharacterized protein n=1 Tax=Leptinotarsa decemlineata TaxID=7539 RepID=UPI003D30C87F
MNRTFEYITKSEVLKSQEILQEKASKEWNRKWGFYLDFDKICLEEASKRGYTPEMYRRLVEMRKNKKNLEPDIWKAEASDNFPVTSSGYVGWRSGPNYSLEKFGSLYISPRRTLPHQPPYNCIILG